MTPPPPNNKIAMKEHHTIRESTRVRNEQVRELYKQIVRELGGLAPVVSKGYIYGLIRERTGLNERTIAVILNHPDLRV